MLRRPILKIDRQTWWRLPQQLRFLLAGGYNTLFAYATFGALFLLFGRQVHYLLIGLITNVVAVISAFVVHRKFVFRSTDQWQTTFIRFYLSQLVALGFGMVGLYALVECARLNPLVAQAVIITLSVVLTYVLHRNFSFRIR
jgi:putative flippase GtrA